MISRAFPGHPGGNTQARAQASTRPPSGECGTLTELPSPLAAIVRVRSADLPVLPKTDIHP